MRKSRFETTRWSLVLAAGGAQDAADALATLCEIYWYPLYAYARRQGQDPEDAKDLTQSFFALLLERRDVRAVRRERGRFRSFLLASMRHFLLNQAAYRRAQKRGGGRPALPLEFDTAEGRYLREPADADTPETIFDRRWALTVLDRVFQRLRRDWTDAGKLAQFDHLKICLTGDQPPGGYAQVARELGTSEGAVKIAVHRLKRQYHRVLREEIGATVSTDEAIDDEIRYLLDSLQR